MSPVAGLLLTGGASRRMGRDKAALRLAGEPMAVRLGRLLSGAAGPVLEVGPGRSGLASVREDPPGQGPLAAVAAGARALWAMGWHGPAVVLACDLPLLTSDALALLADWPGTAAVLPAPGGRRQPLCARWAHADLAAAAEGAALGRRAIGDLPAVPPGIVLGPGDWSGVGPEPFVDADGPEDLRALGFDLAEPPAAADAGGRR